jgi:hypothetical protein
METIKQIIYREEDRVLVPCPDSNAEIIAHELDSLSVEDKASCEALRDWCIDKLEVGETLAYVVYINDGYNLTIEATSGKLVKFKTNELDPSDKAIVDAVGQLCTILINE